MFRWSSYVSLYLHSKFRSNLFKLEFTNDAPLPHPFQVQITQSSLEGEKYYDGVSIVCNTLVLRALAQELIDGAWSADAGRIDY